MGEEMMVAGSQSQTLLGCTDMLSQRLIAFSPFQMRALLKSPSIQPKCFFSISDEGFIEITIDPTKVIFLHFR